MNTSTDWPLHSTIVGSLRIHKWFMDIRTERLLPALSSDPFGFTSCLWIPVLTDPFTALLSHPFGFTSCLWIPVLTDSFTLLLSDPFGFISCLWISILTDILTALSSNLKGSLKCLWIPVHNWGGGRVPPQFPRNTTNGKVDTKLLIWYYVYSWYILPTHAVPKIIRNSAWKLSSCPGWSRTQCFICRAGHTRHNCCDNLALFFTTKIVACRIAF